MLIVVCIYETKKTGGWVPAFSSLFFCFWLLLDFQSFLLNGKFSKGNLRRAEKKAKGAIEKGINDAKQKTLHTHFLEKVPHQKSNIHKKRTHTLSLKRRNTRAHARELLEREKERKKKNTERSFPLHSFLPSSPSILRAEEEEEHGEHGRARNN